LQLSNTSNISYISLYRISLVLDARCSMHKKT
jgi:hypothetical protein